MISREKAGDYPMPQWPTHWLDADGAIYGLAEDPGKES